MAISLLILAGLALIVIFAIAVVVIVLLSQRQKLAADQERMQGFIKRQESAVWASAMIVSARGGVVGSETGVSQWARYELSLQVTPPNGETYSAHTAWLVDVAQMSMLQQGQQLSVKIDQQDPKIIYPNASWAKYIPA